MNELFKNFGISSNVNSNENISNTLVGNVVEIKNNQLRLEELIAEGGFGYVYRAKDLKTSKIYAIKRMIGASNESKNEIDNEISMLERVQSHKHIMKFYGFYIVKPNIYYLLCEYCGYGSLSKITLPISNKQLLNRILFQISLALEKLHLFGIIHRDIKIDNILFDNNGFVKLCDFGSATDKSFKPDLNWTPIQRSLLEDEMNRHTTPMYRPPEILDTYLHYEINTQMDIWAFGCLIYFLRFGQHPFEDSSKLRIINCKYTIPAHVNHSDTIVTIIKNCLQVNPDNRTNASQIIKLMEENFVDLNSPCELPNQAPLKTSPEIGNNGPNNLLSTTNVPGIAQSYLAGFTRYIKDTSNKVMQTVQSSIARQDLDLTFFTNRFVVMSYPAEGLESAYRNHIEDVRAILESRQAPYSVVNISGRSYDSFKFGTKVKVIDGGISWKDPKKVASLQSIILLCDYIFKWLNENSHNMIVIHCMDGRNNSAMLTISFFILVGLITDYHIANELFVSKRGAIELIESHYRYLNYITLLKNANLSFFSIKKNVILKTIKMIGIPLFTKLRDGCRPFVELFINLNTKLYSTFTDYEKLTPYTKNTHECVLWKDINKTFDLTSDVTLIISHARSTISSKMLNQTKLTAIRIASLQFNLFFETDQQDGNKKIIFYLNDIDYLEEESDRFPFDFKLIIEFEIVSSSDNIQRHLHPDINENEILLVNKPDCLFMDNREYEEFLELNKLSQNAQCTDSLVNNLDSTKQDSKLISDNLYSLNENSNETTPVDKKDPLLNLSFPINKSSTADDLFKETLLGDDLSPQIDLINNKINSKLTTDDLLSMDNSFNLDSPNEEFLKPTTMIDDKLLFLKKANNLSKNPSTPNLAANLDPFGDLNKILNFNNSSNNSSIPRVSSCNNFPEDTKNSKLNNTSNTPKQTRPDYSRHNFEEVTSKTGIKGPKIAGNEFEDLLSGFKKTSPDNSSAKSIGQIRKEELLKEGANPNRLKVSEWTENKEKNIRALLCSLNTVVWQGCNWSPIGMHQLLTPNDVKKMYRKACLAVHPDKLVDNPNQELAKYIFMALNDAWTEFEKNSR